MNGMVEGLVMLESWGLGLVIFRLSVVITDRVDDGFYDRIRKPLIVDSGKASVSLGGDFSGAFANLVINALY